jgi:hypothetical protein
MDQRTSIEIRTATLDKTLCAAQVSLCEEVFLAFGDELPERRVICLLDDANTLELDKALGTYFRGFHYPLLEYGYSRLPLQITQMFLDPYTKTHEFDTLIYLHSRSITSEISIIFTLAHEIQHLIQYGNYKKLWTADYLIRELCKLDPTLGLTKWSDFPSEVDAVLKSKKIAVQLRGDHQVEEFASVQIANLAGTEEETRWSYIRGASTSENSRFALSTDELVQRYRSRLETLIAERFSDDPVCSSLDFARPHWWEN